VAGEQEPTNWELFRLLQSIDARLGSMEARFVTVEVFKAHQEQTAERFRDSTTDLTEWKSESRGAHASLAADIKAEADKREGLERAQRTQRQQTWFGVGLAGLSMVLSVIGSLVLRGLGAG
jgi:hypothetical protein